MFISTLHCFSTFITCIPLSCVFLQLGVLSILCQDKVFLLVCNQSIWESLSVCHNFVTLAIERSLHYLILCMSPNLHFWYGCTTLKH